MCPLSQVKHLVEWAGWGVTIHSADSLDRWLRASEFNFWWEQVIYDKNLLNIFASNVKGSEMLPTRVEFNLENWKLQQKLKC
jgi:hypothetical protein